ncbi:MAG: GNAT family N-acetyltransferase [Pseudomonadota bacterium]
METYNNALRPMQQEDLPAVLAIIEAIDDDDSEEAEADYSADGIADQFVLEIDGEVKGVTGFRLVPATEGTAWLSWTYLHVDLHGRGLGRAMLDQLRERLAEDNVRKIFAKISDYTEPDGTAPYAAAKRLYEAVGFAEELTTPDYYAPGEALTIYGLDLQPPEEAPDPVADEKVAIRFNGLHEIADTDGAYSFDWTVIAKPLFGKRAFSEADLHTGLVEVKRLGGREVYLSFAANLPLIHEPLQGAGFKYAGTLKNYFEPGLDEMHFVHNLEGV